MKNSILKGLWVVAGVALLLLILHTARVLAIRVDNTSVLLLIIAIACFLAPWLTKIRFGEFEVEIGPKEVERLKETVEKHVPEPTEVKSVLIAGRTRAAQAITDLVVIDPDLLWPNLGSNWRGCSWRHTRLPGHLKRQPGQLVQVDLFGD